MTDEYIAYEITDDEVGATIAVEFDFIDKQVWEKFFHTLPTLQLHILVMLYVGMTPKEIMSTLNFKNPQKYYNESHKLKTLFRKKKQEVTDYN